ncbi:alpha/beta hydrolase fold domain-containing protein [Hymenobacter sp. B81]|uniref:alpha/beta hydrolase fold domain-containing protein n=1 Tax=Hymenobacter sp. B81 TaxID=3344878 RepID=UPI0037DDDE21
MRVPVLLSLLLLLAGAARAQIDTTGGKFYRPLYPSVSVEQGVAYGEAVDTQGTPQVLRLDVYQPVGGPTAPRPLVILAHGGAFLFGSRTDYDVSELCRRLARLGYVAASIDYRLEPSPFTFSGARAVVQATHDMRAAVRFFRRSALGANPYNLQPRYIFAGGSSAGAITALHTAYLDQPAELAALNAGVAGGLEGSSGNPGYSSQVRAVINLCGGLGNPLWLEAGDEPLVSVHGTSDAVVPYQMGVVFGNVLYGSGALQPRADQVGVPNVLRPLKGAGHVPYNNSSAYMDTTFRTVRDFLRPLLGLPGTPGPLPVTLTRFEVRPQGAHALLSWETATETRSRGFGVEVSVDGQAFRPLSFVPSQPGEAGHRYRFLDAEPGKAGRRYYRLRQLDLDGAATLYGPRMVEFAASAGQLRAWPNPFSSEVTAEISLENAAVGEVQLLNALGQVVFSRQLLLPAGTSPLPLPTLGALPPGTYGLRCVANGKISHLRLLKY